MNDRDVRDMIARCIEEITMLRKEVERLAPQAEAYRAIRSILGLLQEPPMGASEDIVWRLRKQLEALEPKPDAAATD